MRRIGLALLATLAGCNQVFGIKNTERVPDAPEFTYTGKMQWASGAAMDGEIDVFPIGAEAVDSEPPDIQIGPMLGSGDLVAAPYDSTTGGFHVGFMLAGQPWRLVYRLPGDSVMHELQWTVQTPDLVVPRFTRKDLPPPPTGSGYDIQPTPAAHFGRPMVATSGAYTSSFAMGSDYSDTELMYPFPERATPIEGPLAAPAASDWVLIADWAPGSVTVEQIVGWSIATNATLVADALTPLAPAWNVGPMLSIKPVPNGMAAQTRMLAALNALGVDDTTHSPLPFQRHMTYGLSPNTGIYGFVPGAPDCGMPRQGEDADLSGIDCLGAPALIPLVDDKAFDTTLQVPQIDQSIIANQPVMYARLSQARTVHGVALTSAIQSLVLAPSMPTSGESIDVLSTTVASAVLCDQMTFDSADISGAMGPVMDDVPTGPATTSPRTLTFHPRLGQDNTPTARADDFVVTLYEIQNPDTQFAKLHTIRVYDVIDYTAGVTIDGALLPPGLYVFSVTTRVGMQNASTGDFRAVTYPLGESTVFSRQFRVD